MTVTLHDRWIFERTLVYCGQMVGWIKMPPGTEIGLCPSDIVLDGDPAVPMERGTAAPLLFGLASYKNSSTGELGLREETVNVWSVSQVQTSINQNIEGL